MVQVAKSTKGRRKFVQRLVIFFIAVACIVPFMGSVFNPAKAANGSTPTDSDIPSEVSQKNGLFLGKSTTLQGKRSAEITLSQYATGTVTTDSQKKGSDVVLLLDGSASMKGDPITNLKTAVSKYIGSIADAAKADDVSTRFSVILFSGTRDESAATKTVVSFDDGNALDTNAVESAKQQVAKIKAGYGTDTSTAIYAPGNGTMTGSGVEAAYDALNAEKDDGNNKVMIMFTDGVPGTVDSSINAWYNKGNCSTGEAVSHNDCVGHPYEDPVYEANKSIEYSDKIKEELGGRVFAFGYFTQDADAIMSDDATKDGNKWSDQTWAPTNDTTTKTVSTKRMVSMFGCDSGYWLDFLHLLGPCYATTTTTVNATNYSGAMATRRFLEAVSSDGDFSKATSKTSLMTDATIPDWAKKPIKDEANATAQYMTAISKAGDISDAFASLVKIPHDDPDLTAGNRSTAADFASKYFNVPSDATNIKVYEEAVKSVEVNSSGVVQNIEWSNDIQPVTVVPAGQDGVHVELTTTADGNSGIKVTGWDYSVNYVGPHTDSLNSGFYGKRLIVRFTEDAKPNTAGSVPTNDTDNSIVTNDTGDPIGKYPDPGNINVTPLYDGSWIPDCDTSTNYKNGVCLGKKATYKKDANGDRTAQVALSAFETGGMKQTGSTVETKPVDIYYVLDYSNIPDQLNTDGQSGQDYGTQWKEENTAIQRVLQNQISAVNTSSVKTRLDITTYAGSTKGSATNAVNHVLSVDNSTDASALSTAKNAFAGTACTTSGCTGDAAPTGTAAQLGTAMDAVWAQMQGSSSEDKKLVVVMSPQTGLGAYSWASSLVGCSTTTTGTKCSSTSDPLAQADQAIAAAQKMKAAGATILSYSGIEGSGAQGAAWTNLSRSDITSQTADNTGTMKARQMQELVSSNTWGVTQMGVDSAVKVVTDLTQVPKSGTSKVVFSTGSESDEPGPDGQGYFYASVLTDSAAAAYFENNVSELVQTTDVPDFEETPDYTGDVTITDYASAYFQVPVNATDVQVYEQPAVSKDYTDPNAFAGAPTQLWGTDDGDTDTPSAPDSNMKVTRVKSSKGNSGYTVTGWDFSKNYVGQHSDASFFGKRLIIRFTETLNDCFIGGEGVPTNETDTPGAYSSNTELVGFPAPTVDVPASTGCAKVTDGKAYLGGNIDFSKIVTSQNGDPLTFPTLADGTSRNDDYATGLFTIKNSDGDMVGQLTFKKGQEKGSWASGTASAVGTDKDQKFTVTPAVTMSAGTDKLAAADKTVFDGSSTVYALIPQVSVGDTLVNAGDANDFSKNFTTPIWRAADADKSTRATANDDLTVLNTPLVSEKVTGTTMYDYVQGDQPATNPGDATYTGFAPTQNSDFNVFVRLVSASGVTTDAKTANEGSPADVVTFALDGQPTSADTADSIDNGGSAAHDFRVWVVNAYVDPGFPKTCVTDGNMCLGKEVSDVTTDPASGKRSVTVTLTAYLKGTASGAADTAENEKTKLADYASAYFKTDKDARNVKVWEQSASDITGQTVEFKRNPVLLSDQSKPANEQVGLTADMASYQGGILVQTMTSKSGNPGFNVQGWNYVSNYVGARSGSGVKGKRIVVQFKETLGDCFVGGDKVPANEDTTPGIYTLESGVIPGLFPAGFTKVAKFAQPTVNVPAPTNCAYLNNKSAVKSDAAYQYATIGGNDGKGFSSLLKSDDAANTFISDNSGSTLTWTFSVQENAGDPAMTTVGSYSVAPGASFADGTWNWNDGANKYMEGVGKHIVKVQLTASTQPDTPVATWGGVALNSAGTNKDDVKTVDVFVPVVVSSDSTVNVGESNSMSMNFTSEISVGNPEEQYTNQLMWSDATGGSVDAINLSEKPDAKVQAVELEEAEPGKIVNETDTIKPTTNTTFKVQVALSGAALADKAPTTVGPTGQTSLTESQTDQNTRLVEKNTKLLATNVLISFGSNNKAGVTLGAPTATAEDMRDRDGTKAAFTVYVKGQTVSAIPLTGEAGTARWFITLGIIVAAVAAGTLILRKYTSSRI